MSPQAEPVAEVVPEDDAGLGSVLHETQEGIAAILTGVALGAPVVVGRAILRPTWADSCWSIWQAAPQSFRAFRPEGLTRLGPKPNV